MRAAVPSPGEGSGGAVTAHSYLVLLLSQVPDGTHQHPQTNLKGEMQDKPRLCFLHYCSPEGEPPWWPGEPRPPGCEDERGGAPWRCQLPGQGVTD